MTIEEINERRESLVRFVFPTDASARKRFELDLDEKEFSVVGYALIHWSFMEHALLHATVGLAKAIGVPVPKNAKQDSLRRRLRRFGK